MVEWLFLLVPWGCLPFVIVVFPDHTHLLFLLIKHKEDCYGINNNIERPTKDKSHITFKNHMHVPYVNYADFESIVKPETAKAGD